MNLDLGTIITFVIGLIATFLAGFWLVAKGKIKKVIDAGKELLDVGNALNAALADNKITKEEIDELKKEWKEAKEACKAIFQK